MPYDPEDHSCPKCGAECWRDSVDVGIGYMYGPFGCPDCGWSEDSDLDRTNPDKKFIQDGRWTDRFGNSHSIERVIENSERFGLGEAAKKAFEE